MTTRDLELAQASLSGLVLRHRRSVVTLGLALLGFFVGESFGQELDANCSSCRVSHVPGVGTGVKGLDPSRSFLTHARGAALPSRDPWLVEGGWSGVYYAPQL